MKKIMFNDKYGLTKAVLDGRKTQTRRIIKIKDDCLCRFKEEYYNASLDLLDGKDLIEAYFVNNPKKIPYKVGEIVAVAQSYKTIDDYYKSAYSYNHSAHGMTICEFDGVSDKDVHKWNMIAVNYRGKKVWTNKLYVKPELMLHFIRITNVRIERLNDISNDDCLKEGIVKCDAEDCNNRCYLMSKCNFCHCGNAKDTPREAYAVLIDKVGKKGDWGSNPYVFVYDFELVK